MRKSIMIWGVLAVMCSLVILGGCREKIPTTELDRYLAEHSDLQGKALEDALREEIASGSPRAVYASYLLGNHFYAEASDSAAVSGWNGEGVNALLDSAEVYLTRAVDMDSTFVEAMVNLGSLWDDRSQQMSSRQEMDQRMNQAELYYRRAIAVDPYNEKAHCNLGSLFLRQKKTQQALGEFQGVLDHDPHSALAHYNLAIMFAEAKIYREAKREWELASKYDPKGDIGDRSRDNIKIVEDLMSASTPDNLKK